MAIPKSPSVAEVIDRYGRCLELVSMDPHFHNITVGLYVKDTIGTVWTYSQKPGVVERIRKIRDQVGALGGMVAVQGSPNQVTFSCGYFHKRPTKFLLAQAVEKDPNYAVPAGPIAIKDTKTKLTLSVAPKERNGRWVYEVSAEGEAPNVPARVAAIVGGFVRYGEMEKLSNTEAAFACGARHDQLVRLLVPFARNVSAIEEIMQAADLRGQLTTGTAGFTPL